MSLKKLMSRYARYNHWATGKMIQWLKTLDEKILYKKTLSSFGSIDLTLQHMNQAQLFWFAIITEADVTKLDEAIEFNTTYGIFNGLLASSQQILEKCEAYTEEEFLKQLPSTDMVQSRYEYILHVINHNSYHRGQIVTISRSLGVSSNIPAMDYEAFLWSDH